MKSDKLHKIAFLGLFTLLAAVPVLQSCDDDEKQKAVDLRYRVEDSYLCLLYTSPSPRDRG